MEWQFFPLLIGVGLLAGVLAGLLGIGGGLVIVPFLYAIFRQAGWEPDEVMHIAIGTSLASTVVTTFVSTLSHHLKKAVDYRALRLYIGGLLIGCVAGALIAQMLSGPILKVIFGCMACLLGIYYFFPTLPSFSFSASPNRTLNFFGLGVGILSSLLGIGGGIFSIPVLLGYNLPMQRAVATSSAATLASVWLGTLTYLVVAWHSPHHLDTFGYIELPAFAAISIGSICTTPLAVKWAHRVSVAFLKRIFGIVLLLTGISLIIF